MLVPHLIGGSLQVQYRIAVDLLQPSFTATGNRLGISGPRNDPLRVRRPLRTLFRPQVDRHNLAENTAGKTEKDFAYIHTLRNRNHSIVGNAAESNTHSKLAKFHLARKDKIAPRQKIIQLAVHIRNLAQFSRHVPPLAASRSTQTGAQLSLRVSISHQR